LGHLRGTPLKRGTRSPCSGSWNAASAEAASQRKPRPGQGLVWGRWGICVTRHRVGGRSSQVALPRLERCPRWPEPEQAGRRTCEPPGRGWLAQIRTSRRQRRPGRGPGPVRPRAPRLEGSAAMKVRVQVNTASPRRPPTPREPASHSSPLRAPGATGHSLVSEREGAHVDWDSVSDAWDRSEFMEFRESGYTGRASPSSEAAMTQTGYRLPIFLDVHTSCTRY
jgi:hypothetical protein